MRSRTSAPEARRLILPRSAVRPGACDDPEPTCGSCCAPVGRWPGYAPGDAAFCAECSRPPEPWEELGEGD
jgi:hypothetical protein